MLEIPTTCLQCAGTLCMGDDGLYFCSECGQTYGDDTKQEHIENLHTRNVDKEPKPVPKRKADENVVITRDMIEDAQDKHDKLRLAAHEKWLEHISKKAAAVPPRPPAPVPPATILHALGAAVPTQPAPTQQPQQQQKPQQQQHKKKHEPQPAA